TCTIDRDDVRVILLVCGENECDDLRLITEGLRKQRPDGTGDLTRGQNLLFARPAFALDETPGNSATSIGVLAVIDCEREEVNALPRFGGSNGRDKHNAVTLRYQHGAGSLFGHAASFKSESLAAGKLNGNFLFHGILVFCAAQEMMSLQAGRHA